MTPCWCRFQECTLTDVSAQDMVPPGRVMYLRRFKASPRAPPAKQDQHRRHARASKYLPSGAKLTSQLTGSSSGESHRGCYCHFMRCWCCTSCRLLMSCKVSNAAVFGSADGCPAVLNPEAWVNSLAALLVRPMGSLRVPLGSPESWLASKLSQASVLYVSAVLAGTCKLWLL